MRFLILLLFVLFAWRANGDDSCPGLPHCFCNKDKTSVNCDGKQFSVVPDNIPENVTKLYLRYNNIVKMPSKTFTRYAKLEKLFLDHNKISQIDPFAFAGAQSLTYIDLRDNKLSVVGQNAFSQLPSLEELYLLTNGLEQIEDRAFEDTENLKFISLQSNSLTSIPSLGRQPKLQKLILQGNSIKNATFPTSFAESNGLYYIGLSNNAIKTLDNDTFKFLGNISVSSLLLSNNKLTRIEAGAFDRLAAITSLKLGQNPLNNTGLKVALNSLRGKNIVSIDISGLRLNGRLLNDTFKPLLDTALTTLGMRYNAIPKLFSNSFIGLDDLLHLDISSCQITETETNAFAGLDKLQILNLQKNKLMSVPENLPRALMSLFLDDNQINTIKSKAFATQMRLQELRIRYNKVQTLEQDSFWGLVNLNKLDLRNNYIATLPGSVFDNLGRLTSLNIAQNNLVFIQNATGRFSALGSLVYFNMADNKCTYLQRDLFQNMLSLKYLHLEKNNLGGLIGSDFDGTLFRNLANLEELHIMENSVSEIHPPAFQDLTSLSLLNLTNNKVKRWGKDLFKTTRGLKYLDLTNNLITVLKKEDIDQFSGLQKLNLTGNPFVCSCDLRWFRDWINQTSVQLYNVKSYTCSEPKGWAGKPLLSFDRKKINCTFYTWQEILIIAGSVAVIVTIVAIIVYRRRWSLKLSFYKWRYGNRKHLPLGNDGRGNYGAINENGMVFDAYISCAEDDKVWAIENLLYGIDKGKIDDERPFGGEFSLYFEDRDSEPGNTIIYLSTNGYFENKKKTNNLIYHGYFLNMNAFSAGKRRVL